MNGATFTSRFGRLWSFADRHRAFKLTFNLSYASQTVLGDLCDFCKGMEETFNADPRVDAYMQGRRSVWLRITNNLNLTPEQYMALLQGRSLTPPKENEG